MSISELLEAIGRKGSDKEAIAVRISRSPELIAQLFEGLGASKANVKFGCARVLETISTTNPDVLYPVFDRFVHLLRADNKILQWEAIRIIANLAPADSDGKIEHILDEYLAPIRGPVMITAANVIKGAAVIAAAKPHLAGKIAGALLGVEKARYRTAECRNIALGHAIEAFDLFFDRVEYRKPVLELVRRQRVNRRNATKRKAERFLKKHV
jgi:hypothetical protein